jgi:hypothetical protein
MIISFCQLDAGMPWPGWFKFAEMLNGLVCEDLAIALKISKNSCPALEPKLDA